MENCANQFLSMPLQPGSICRSDEWCDQTARLEMGIHAIIWAIFRTRRLCDECSHPLIPKYPSLSATVDRWVNRMLSTLKLARRAFSYSAGWLISTALNVLWLLFLLDSVCETAKFQCPSGTVDERIIKYGKVQRFRCDLVFLFLASAEIEKTAVTFRVRLSNCV